jgi:hypothetical protein
MDFSAPAFISDFAVSATVGGVACRGIFDAAYADPLGIASTRPQLVIRAADLPAVATGQTAIVPAGTYTVRGIEPDGTGFATLILERA